MSNSHNYPPETRAQLVKWLKELGFLDDYMITWNPRSMGRNLFSKVIERAGTIYRKTAGHKFTSLWVVAPDHKNPAENHAHQLFTTSVAPNSYKACARQGGMSISFTENLRSGSRSKISYVIDHLENDLAIMGDCIPMKRAQSIAKKVEISAIYDGSLGSLLEIEHIYGLPPGTLGNVPPLAEMQAEEGLRYILRLIEEGKW